jgi:hypothetical protein
MTRPTTTVDDLIFVLISGNELIAILVFGPSAIFSIVCELWNVFFAIAIQFSLTERKERRERKGEN